MKPKRILFARFLSALLSISLSAGPGPVPSYAREAVSESGAVSSTGSDSLRLLEPQENQELVETLTAGLEESSWPRAAEFGMESREFKLLLAGYLFLYLESLGADALLWSSDLMQLPGPVVDTSALEQSRWVPYPNKVDLIPLILEGLYKTRLLLEPDLKELHQAVNADAYLILTTGQLRRVMVFVQDLGGPSRERTYVEAAEKIARGVLGHDRWDIEKSLLRLSPDEDLPNLFKLAEAIERKTGLNPLRRSEAERLIASRETKGVRLLGASRSRIRITLPHPRHYAGRRMWGELVARIDSGYLDEDQLVQLFGERVPELSTEPRALSVVEITVENLGIPEFRGMTTEFQVEVQVGRRFLEFSTESRDLKTAEIPKEMVNKLPAFLAIVAALAPKGIDRLSAGLEERRVISELRVGEIPLQLVRENGNYVLEGNGLFFVGEGNQLRNRHVLPLEEDVLVYLGRDPNNQVQISSFTEGVDPLHMAFLLDFGGSIQVIDLGSEGGTWQGNQRIERSPQDFRLSNGLYFIFQRGNRYFLAGPRIIDPAHPDRYRPSLEIPFDGEGRAVLGRASENAVTIRGEEVSRRHAMLILKSDGRVWVRDEGSANGTWIGEEDISGRGEFLVYDPLREDIQVEIDSPYPGFSEMKQAVRKIMFLDPDRHAQAITENVRTLNQLMGKVEDPTFGLVLGSTISLGDYEDPDRDTSVAMDHYLGNFIERFLKRFHTYGQGEILNENAVNLLLYFLLQDLPHRRLKYEAAVGFQTLQLPSDRESSLASILVHLMDQPGARGFYDRILLDAIGKVGGVQPVVDLLERGKLRDDLRVQAVEILGRHREELEEETALTLFTKLSFDDFKPVVLAAMEALASLGNRQAAVALGVHAIPELWDAKDPDPEIRAAAVRYLDQLIERIVEQGEPESPEAGLEEEVTPDPAASKEVSDKRRLLLTRERLGLSQEGFGELPELVKYNEGRPVPPITISRWESEEEGSPRVPEAVLDLLPRIYEKRAPSHLRRTRERLGLSRGEFGELPELVKYNGDKPVHQSTISRWELESEEPGSHKVPEAVLDLLPRIYEKRAPGHLRRTRERLGLSLDKFGELLGQLGYNKGRSVPRTTISRWESEKPRIRRRVPEAVLDLLPRIYEKRAPGYLRRSRERLGLSQGEFGKLPELVKYNERKPVPTSTISDWESEEEGSARVPEAVLDLLPSLAAAGLEESAEEGLDREVEKIVQVLRAQRQGISLLGISPSRMESVGPELLALFERLDGQLPQWDPFLVLIGEGVSQYEDHASVLLAVENLDGVAVSLSMLGAGRMDYLASEEEALVLQETLRRWGIQLEQISQEELPVLLRQLLGALAGLDPGLSRTQVDPFSGVDWNELAEYLKRLVRIGV